MASLNKSIDRWKDSAAQLVFFKEGMAKSHKSLKDHLKSRATEKSKAEKDKQTAEVKLAQEAARAVAKAAAKKVADQAKLPDPLFEIDIAALVKEGVVQPVQQQNGAIHAKSADVPCLYCNTAAVMAWESIPKIQVSTGNYGSKYKLDDNVKKTMRGQVDIGRADGIMTNPPGGFPPV